MSAQTLNSQDLEHIVANNGILLFDGVCNLCNASINYVIDRDPEGYFRFASLQSETGKQLKERFGIRSSGDSDPDSVILIENGNVYQRSTAALMVARKLQGPVKLLYLFIVIPPFLRNIVYNIIARNRYAWFGKRDECRVPTPEVKALFLE